MEELEEKVYQNIKKELVDSVIDKKIDTYFTNKNELTHYYNVGKMIIEAQGGEERAKYGDNLVKKISKRLTKELGKGYDFTTLKRMRKFYLIIEKGATLWHQLSWSHYRELLSLKNVHEINYYIQMSVNNHLGVRSLHNVIKSKEYQRLDNKTKDKLIINEKTNIYDLIKNPIYINTYNNLNRKNIEEKVLKAFILKDIDNFLLQLGNGFAYMANEYKIMIGNKPNYIDMLLYNAIYNCYVVVELKTTESNKNHLGQIQVYMNYIDKNVKNINQNKTIGIIVCKKDNKYLIEYSSDERIRITTYELIEKNI